MPTKITLDMPMFGNIRNNLNQVMIDTINKSPILVQQLTQYNDAVIAGSALKIGATQGGGSYLDRVLDGVLSKDQIRLDLKDNWATNKPYIYYDGAGIKHTISPEGLFVGVLSHEIGHYINAGIDNKQLSKISPSDPEYVTTQTSMLVYREGEAAYNNFMVRKEILANGGQEIDLRGANYQYGQTVANNVYSNMLAQMDKVYTKMVVNGSSAEMIKEALQDYAASYIALLPPSTSKEPGATYWNDLKKTVTPKAPTDLDGSQVSYNLSPDGFLESVVERRADGAIVVLVDANHDGLWEQTAVVANGVTTTKNYDLSGSLLNTSAKQIFSDGSVLETITKSDGSILKRETDVSGNVKETPVESGMQNALFAVGATVNFLNLINPIQSGKPLPIVAAGVNTLADLQKLTNNGQVNTVLNGTGAVLGALSSLQWLQQSIRNNDALGTVVAGAQTISYGAQAYSAISGTKIAVDSVINQFSDPVNEPQYRLAA